MPKPIPLPCLLLLAVTLFTVQPAVAGIYGLPSDKAAIVTVDIPPSWRPKVTKRGVEASSIYNTIKISAEAIGTEKDLPQARKDAVAALKAQGVDFNENSPDDTNDLPEHELYFEGRDRDGRARISLVDYKVVKQVVLMVLWTSGKAGESDLSEEGGIMGSVRAAAAGR